VAQRTHDPLIDLLLDPTLELKDFRKAASRFTSKHLCRKWEELLRSIDCDRPEYAVFLERLQDFLEKNGGCKPHKAVLIMSKWPLLTRKDHYMKYLDLIELLLVFVNDPEDLLKAVARVRDDGQCRNQRFFKLLIDHIRLQDTALATAEEALVSEEWPTEGDAEGDRADVEMEKRAEAGDVPDEDDQSFVEDSESIPDTNSAEVDFDCDPRHDLMEWLQDRTESSSCIDHRCPAAEARKDYEEWVEQSPFPRQRIGKQAFAQLLEIYHPKVAENGHRFFTGLVLKSAFRSRQASRKL